MIVFLDTNVILDILMERESYFQASYESLKKLLTEGAELFLSASAVTDIYYLLRKALGDRAEAIAALDTLLHLVGIADVRSTDIQKALTSDVYDFEDAVLVEVAARYSADLILSRNTKDFKKSQIQVQSPDQFSGL